MCTYRMKRRKALFTVRPAVISMQRNLHFTSHHQSRMHVRLMLF
jgi:hypothetical protein